MTWSTIACRSAISMVGFRFESGRPTSVPDFIATIARAVGIDGTRQNLSNVGRPIRIVEPTGQAIPEVLA